MIPRAIDLATLSTPGKAAILYGPRRAGKTTLLTSYLQGCGLRYRLETGDNIRMQHLLGSADLQEIMAFAEGYDLIAIDEAQQIPGIGTGLKLLVDHRPDLRIIATGSSSFDLAGAVGEPLTGRKRTATLYPISQMELAATLNRFDLKERDGGLFGFEFKWSEKRRAKPPKSWSEAYPEGVWQMITQGNYLDFILA